MRHLPGQRLEEQRVVLKRVEERQQGFARATDAEGTPQVQRVVVREAVQEDTLTPGAFAAGLRLQICRVEAGADQDA